MPNRIRAAVRSTAGATVAGLVSKAISRTVTPGPAWQRTNYAGDPVTLVEGPAVAVGAGTGMIVEAVLAGRAGDPAAGRRAAARLVAVGGSALVGAYDDLLGTTQAKGFGGHLRALRAGTITSGMIKIAGIGVSALAASVIDRPAGRGAGRGAGRIVDVMINTTLIAGTANVTNLLDLRPGRAGKAVLGLGMIIPGSGPLVGAVSGVLADDLAGRSMLGDCGANALGAGLGTAIIRLPRPLRVAVLAGVIGLNLASEKVSFSAVIDDHPVLRTIDRWGRDGP